MGIDTAAFTKGLQGAERSLANVGKSMQKVGAGLSAAVTAPLMGIAYKSVEAFKVQEKALAAVEAQVQATGGAAGFTTDELAKMASSLQAVSTFGDEAILQDVTTSFLKFGNVTGEVFERAQAATLDFAAATGTGLSTAAQTLGRALEDPIRGMATLRRQGIVLTEEQEGLVRQFVAVGDTASAQGVILEALEGRFKGVAAAMAGTTDGQWTQAWNAVGDAMESVGKIIAQYIPPIANGIKAAADAFNELSPSTQNFVVIGGALAAALGPVVVVLGTLAIGIAAINIPVAAAIAGIVALTAAVIAFWPEIKAATEAVIQFGKDGLEYILGMPDRIAEAFSHLAAVMYQMGVDIINGLVEGIKGAGGAVKDALLGVVTGAWNDTLVFLGIRSPSRLFHEVGINIMAGLANGIEAGRPQVQANIAGVTGDVKGPFDDLASSLGQQFSSMFEGLITGTKSAGEAIKGLLQNLGKLLINKAFSALFGGMGGGGFFSSLFGGFRANGGPVSGGKAYVVGERGPELMVPGMSGTVISNENLQGGGGQSVVRVELDTALVGEILAKAQGTSIAIVQSNNRTIPSIVANAQRRAG
jgi:hypothetical protein